MPAGRPKTVVKPCTYCNKQFKRQEHLLRHERTHTKEKPFACNCGRRFTRKDLLTGHIKSSHAPKTIASSSSVEAAPAPTSHHDVEINLNDLDFSWDTSFMDHMLSSDFLGNGLHSNPNSSAIHSTEKGTFSRFSSRMPLLDDLGDSLDECDNAVGNTGQVKPNNGSIVVPWHVTEAIYERLCLEFRSFSSVLPDACALPSRNNLAQYLDKYFCCVHQFLPFIHPPTFSVEKKDIELVLAVAVLGALYRYEHSKAYELYHAADTILEERMRRESVEPIMSLIHSHGYPTAPKQISLGRIQTFILLISFASWADKIIMRDALTKGSHLAILLRDHGISEPDEMPQAFDWHSWVAVEEQRRTLFAAYALLNLHSIAYNVPPLLLNNEIGMFLPCSRDQWETSDSAQWQRVTHQEDLQFQHALRCLFDGKEVTVSSFSIYLLIHGLLQQVYVDRHSSAFLYRSDTSEYIEDALRTWQLSWECSSESDLDPFTPNGPLGLSAAGLLRLAYIRLASDLHPRQGLLWGDQKFQINEISKLIRSPRIDRAILHAAHALSLVVRHGIAFVASTTTPIWTVEHSICSLECAFLLKEWLEMLALTTNFGGLRKTEQKLLQIIDAIIGETSFAETLSTIEEDAAHFRRIGVVLTELWAQTYQGRHVLGIDNIIGFNLQQLAGLSLD